jgi:predicted TIM-barrel fold metal-dependent hydrolase
MVDTGYPYWKRVTIDECAALVTGRQVKEVFRVESAFRGRASVYFDGPALDFTNYLDRYRAACVAAVRERGCIAFKTVIAYRTGLAVDSVSEREARAAYEAEADNDMAAQKVVRDYLFKVTARLAAELGVPLTIHTGFTGLTRPWSYGDPTDLVPALTEAEARDTTFVLLHGGYPWGGAVGYMAAHLPNVYVDLSEVIPSTSIGIERHVEEVLEFAPLSKVMLGSDGLAIPELHWYGLVLAKRALGNILDRLVASGTLRPGPAERYAGMICHETAERLYGLAL